MADIEDLFKKALESGQYLGAGGVGTIGVVKLWEYFKGEKRKDKVDQAADDFRAELSRTIEGLKTDLKTVNERCDRFADERNIAVKESGRLGAKVEGLTDALSELRADRNRLYDEHRIVMMENAALRGQVKTLTDLLERATGVTSPGTIRETVTVKQETVTNKEAA